MTVSNPRRRFVLGRAAQLHRAHPYISRDQALWWAENVHQYEHMGWDAKGRPVFNPAGSDEPKLFAVKRSKGQTCQPESPIRPV